MVFTYFGANALLIIDGLTWGTVSGKKKVVFASGDEHSSESGMGLDCYFGSGAYTAASATSSSTSRTSSATSTATSVASTTSEASTATSVTSEASTASAEASTATSIASATSEAPSASTAEFSHLSERALSN